METATAVVELTPEDLQKFTTYVYKHWPRRGWIKWGIFAGVFVLSTIWLNFGPHTPEPAARPFRASDFLSLPIILGVVLLGMLAFFRWQTGRTRYWKDVAPNALLPNTYSINAEGVTCENTRGRTFHVWSAFREFVETEEYYYAMLSRQNGHVFPKRCFVSPEAAADFARLFRLRLEKSAPAIQAS